MLRRTLLLVALAVVVPMIVSPRDARAQDRISEAVSDAGKGFWGLLVRTPEAVIVDVCGGAANLFAGVATVFSDMFSIGDRAPAGKFVFDSIFSDGLDEIACFTHAAGANAIEIGTRRDFADIPIEREEFIQREGVFHKEAYKTFPYALKSFALAALDLFTGIPANACRMVGLKDQADTLTGFADNAAGTFFGPVQWKYKDD